MSRYSFVRNPFPTTSPVTGPSTPLVQVPSYGASTMSPLPVAAAATAGAANAGGGALVRTILGNLLADVVGQGVGAVVTPGAPLGPTPAQGSSGSKYMITLQDVKEIQNWVAQENFRRSALNNLGADMPLLNADEIIREREAQLRRSAAEAGAREYAIKQLDVEQATRPALAQALGTGLASMGNIGQQAVATYGVRPDITAQISEIGRAF